MPSASQGSDERKWGKVSGVERWTRGIEAGVEGDGAGGKELGQPFSIRYVGDEASRGELVEEVHRA